MNASLIAVSCALLLQVSSSEPRSVISGRVVSAETGQGLRGVNVILSGQVQNQRAGRTSVTDSEGAFRVDRLPAGTYTVIPHKHGYRPAQSAIAVALAHDQERTGLELKMHRPGVVTGSVTDAEGRPAIGAEVSAFRVVWEGGRRSVVREESATTDDRGMWRIFGLEAGRYLIGATAPPEALSPGELEMSLSAYYPSGARLAEAAPMRVRWGQELGGVNLTLRPQPSVTVAGRVFDAAGGPCASCSVGVGPIEDTGQSLYRRERVAPNGSFRIGRLVPGAYRISADRPGPQSAAVSRTIEVATKNLAEVNLIVGLERAVEGRVVFQKPPASSNWERQGLEVILQGDGGVEPQVGVAQDLTFSIRELMTTSYRVLLGGLPPDGYLKTLCLSGRELPGPDIELPEQGVLSPLEVVVAFDSATISGTVKFPVPGTRPAAGAAAVVLFPQQEQSPYLVERRIETDAGGGFTLRGIAPGAYIAFAVPSAGGPLLEDPEVRSRYQTYGKSLRLGSGERVSVELPLVSQLEE